MRSFLLWGSILSLLFPPSLSPATDTSELDDIIPITMGNLRGHRALAQEGWFIVTSSQRALEYAREHSLERSADAIRRAVERGSSRGSDLAEGVSGAVERGLDLAGGSVVLGRERASSILAATHKTGRAEMELAGASFQKGWGSLIKGNLALVRHLEEGRKELADLSGRPVRKLRKDWNNVFDLTSRVNRRSARRIKKAWGSALRNAGESFRSEYESSGGKSNSLVALGPILWGYLKALFTGVAEPLAETVVRTSVAGAAGAVFLPTAATVIVTGRTVESAGLAFFCVGKTGVRVLSPTVEGGLLNGLALLSLAAVPPTYAAGGTWGAMNQVAFATAGPAYAAVETAVHASALTGAYVGFVTYDAVRGTTEVAIHQAKSGVVLGYNALTALPAHSVMGLGDAAVFLAWDGPRLAVAVARGRVGGKDAPAGVSSTGDLPVGTVVDLDALEQEGALVEVLSRDEAVLREIIRKLPEDLRERSMP